MPQGRAYISSRYQEYRAIDTSALQTEVVLKQLVVLDQLLREVARGDLQVALIQKLAAQLIDQQQDRKLGRIWTSARKIQQYGQILAELLHQHPRLDLKQALAVPVVTSLTNDAESLALTTDRITGNESTVPDVFQRAAAKLRDRTISLIKHIAILKNLWGEQRASLMLEQRAAQVRTVKPKRSRVLFDEADVQISTVLEKFREKGWKVDLRQRDSTVEANEPDTFELSLSLLNRIKQPAIKLLAADSPMGLVRFPVVIQVNTKLSEHLIRLCTDPTVGYNLYVVFGGYVAIDNVLTLGIRQDLALAQTRTGDLQLNLTRFAENLSSVTQRFPEFSTMMPQLQPVQPARVNRQHYYTLLLPKGTLGESHHAIVDWTFLTA
jgi:hypothetical protein